MDLLYQYHYLMNQAAEYRWLAVNQALLSAANKSPSCDESWNIVAQYAQGNSTTPIRRARMQLTEAAPPPESVEMVPSDATPVEMLVAQTLQNLKNDVTLVESEKATSYRIGAEIIPRGGEGGGARGVSSVKEERFYDEDGYAVCGGGLDDGALNADRSDSLERAGAGGGVEQQRHPSRKRKLGMLQLQRLSEDEDEEDEDEEGYATHVARKRAQQHSRSYVKRHQSWRSDHINHHHRADDKWESDPDADPDADHRYYEHHRLNHHRHHAGDHAGYHSSPSPDDDEEEEGEEDYSSDDFAEAHHRESKQRGFYDARGLGETVISAAVKKKHRHQHQHLHHVGGGRCAAACGFPGEGVFDAKDERDKEWAALTTWIRMNLHQPRTAKRKVLFVGHHPTLNPVPGVSQSLSETNDGIAAAGAGAGAGAGATHKSTKKGGGGGKGSSKGGVDGFVFVLNPELDWSDVSHETRVRMKTLVAETQDIFARKYKKRKAWEWELKVQKYRPPGSSGKTFSVPLGNVVRGIQEAFFKYDQTSDGRKTPMTPSPPRELGSAE